MRDCLISQGQGQAFQDEGYTLTDLGYRPKTTVTRGRLPPTLGAETGLPPSQFVRMLALVSSTKSQAGRAECTTF